MDVRESVGSDACDVQPGSAQSDEPLAQPLVIACSLDAGSYDDRVEEWRSFVASSVRSIDGDDTSVRLALDTSDATLLHATSLGQREKACCPFFTVSIELDSDVRTLTLRVPDGAEEVLAAFVVSIRS